MRVNNRIFKHKKKSYNRWYAPIDSMIFSGEKVLEIGCGRGSYLRELRKKGCYVEGIDYYNIDDKSKLKIYKVDLECEDFPMKDNSFDVVLMVETIEHLVNPYKSLREIKRVLKPNGRLIISTHNQTNMFMRLSFLLGKVNACNDVSRQYDLDDDFGHLKGHLRTYSFSILNRVARKEGFKISRNLSWFAINSTLFILPEILVPCFSLHLLVEYRL
jgi:ubiquinone/menaquinone biosynthesis C-methylase UbiE